jgi:excisionase family DNA binding protein
MGNEMRNLTVIPKREQQPNRRPTHSSIRRITNKLTTRHAFTPLIDAKAASTLLGVPYTWLLTQAREGKIPHHRLGHYVRFNPNDLQTWLKETKIEAGIGHRRVMPEAYHNRASLFPDGHK